MYVKVEVYPKAKRESIERIGDHRFKVTVKEPAERNLANKQTLELLAKEYQVSPKMIRLVSGHHSGRKIFSIAKDEH